MITLLLIMQPSHLQNTLPSTKCFHIYDFLGLKQCEVGRPSIIHPIYWMKIWDSDQMIGWELVRVGPAFPGLIFSWR